MVKPIYSLEEVAAFCHVHRQTVARWLRMGEFPYVQLDKKRMVLHEDLMRWWKKRRKQD